MNKMLRPICSIATKSFLAWLFAILMSIASFAQNTGGVIKGIVTDETNTPLQGVTVSIKGSSTGSTTNENGAYTITAKGPDDVIVFSLTGTLTKEVKAGSKKVINVT